MADRWQTLFAHDARVRQRLDAARDAFFEPDLSERLARERAAAASGGSKIYRIGNSLRTLAEEMTFLTVAAQMGAAVGDDVWRRVHEGFLPTLLAQDRVVVQNQDKKPVWNADLWTADIGMSLAIAIRDDGRVLGEATTAKLRTFIHDKCIRPIIADWLDGATRLHSLDSMGHNWWSVIVGGAGVMAAVLGLSRELELITSGLREWFTFPGNELSHKRPNFGTHGDFVEGFGYGEYALLNPLIFAHIHPAFRIVPECLTEAKVQGLARWLRHAFVRDGDHTAAQRFGDITLTKYKPRAEVWHTIARLANDDELLSRAHDLKPAPHSSTELLLWSAPPAKRIEPKSATPIEVFETSGFAFLERDGQRVAVRAGEAWNHNHVDAGTFILHDRDTIWIDDCGTCTYTRPDYISYYTAPRAHNVAYAPDLSPPIRPVMMEGDGVPAHYVAQAANEDVSVLCADTGVLSGGALKRSYRWFLQLKGGILLVWDDLAGYRPTPFTSLLHTTAEVSFPSPQEVVLHKHDRTCTLYPFADPPVEQIDEPAAMGELGISASDAYTDQMGRRIGWVTTAPIERARFGLATGASLKRATWSSLANERGWLCTLDAGDEQWQVWFNPIADGRVMHHNCTVQWDRFETDAYALVRYRKANEVRTYAIHGSFVRVEGQVAASTLRRQLLMSTSV